jgi:hypothetical protein
MADNTWIRNYIQWVTSVYQKDTEKYKSLYEDTLKKLTEMSKNADITGQGSNKKPEEIFEILHSQYIDRIDLIDTQKKLLKKQTTLLNNTNKKLSDGEKTIENTIDKLDTKKRILVYDENDDIFNRKLIFILKTMVVLLSASIGYMVYKRNKK